MPDQDCHNSSELELCILDKPDVVCHLQSQLASDCCCLIRSAVECGVTMTQLQLPNNINIKKTGLLHENFVMLALMTFAAMESGPSPASTAASHTGRVLSHLTTADAPSWGRALVSAGFCKSVLATIRSCLV